MRQLVGTLRLRLEDCRKTEAPLSEWRELQLELLAAARHLQRDATESAPTSSPPPDSRIGLLGMMGDAFWFEREPARLAVQIENVLAALESHARLARSVATR
jgi:hypothetical protein